MITIDLNEKPIIVTNHEKTIGEVRFPPLTMYIRIDICKWMAHTINPSNISDNYTNSWTSYFNIAFSYSVPKNWFSEEFANDEFFDIGEWPIYHPFINNHGYNFRDGNRWYWRNHCWGNYGTGLLNSFFKMDFEAFFILLDRWLYRYEVSGANPLNNIRRTFLGINKETANTELLDLVGYRGIDCHNQLIKIFPIRQDHFGHRWNVDKILNYCNNMVECTFRSKCDPYKLDSEEYTIASLIKDNAGPEIPKDQTLSAERIVCIHE